MSVLRSYFTLKINYNICIMGFMCIAIKLEDLPNGFLSYRVHVSVLHKSLDDFKEKSDALFLYLL